MLRVLHYVSVMDRGGQETFIMNLFRKLNRSQIHFDFLCSESRKGDYDEEIFSLGGTIYYREPLTINGFLKQIQSFYLTYRKLKELKENYDVFHIHTHHAMDAFNSALAAKLAGIKIVVVHSHNTSALYHLKAHALFKKMLNLLNIRRFACSAAAGAWMFGKDFLVLKNGLDLDRFRFDMKKRDAVRLKMGWTDKKIIGHVGRFNEQKNHDFLIDIFEVIYRKDSSSHLVLVGRGELEELIREKVARKGLSEHVTFLGVREDVSDLYQGMDLFLFPSLFEGLPVVLVETQSSDLPCLMSDAISTETILSDSIRMESLSSNADIWASKALDILSEGISRGNADDYIRAGGYDIADLANRLKDIYLKK